MKKFLAGFTLALTLAAPTAMAGPNAKFELNVIKFESQIAECNKGDRKACAWAGGFLLAFNGFQARCARGENLGEVCAVLAHYSGRVVPFNRSPSSGVKVTLRGAIK